jgi:hypothetical protein
MSKIKFLPKRKYKAIRNYLDKVSNILAERRAELEGIRESQPLSQEQINNCTDFELELNDAYRETESLRNYIGDLQTDGRN